MVREKSSEGKKHKPRGRPFPKGNKRGKLEHDVLDVTGLESSVEGGTIAPNLESSNVEGLNAQINDSGIYHQLPKEAAVAILEFAEEFESKAIESSEPLGNEQALPEPVIMDKIEFTNGNNKLCVLLKKKHNRMYRIQIFLNENTEIRPVTYTGGTTALAFWNLLKGSLK